MSREFAGLPSSGLEAGPGLAVRCHERPVTPNSEETLLPDKFCSRTEAGCEFQGLDTGGEQR